MEDLLRSLMQWLPHLRRVEQFKRRPVATQADLLRSLLRRASDTEWGRRYGFADLADAPDVVSAYQARVPLHTYDDLREDATRVRSGAEDVLWPGRITNFAVSSGTVSDGKIIPITDEMIAHDRRFSIGAGINYLRQTLNFNILLGKHLTLPGRIEEDPNYPGTLVGEVSGLLAENAPSYFRTLFQAVPNEISFQPNWEKKLTAIAERTVDQDVRLLVMAPTWALVLFDKLIDVHNARHGASASTVGEVWPNLQVYISGGVALRSYRDLLEEQIGLPHLDFVETYGASEGFFSFQDDLSDPSMLLHLDNGLFFEFVPLRAQNDPDPPRLTIGEVETGVRYALYITSCSGLWSYDVGDVVRFTQTFPHKIVVAGRTTEMIDKYGEAVFGDEARAALQAACDATGARVSNYHVAPRALSASARNAAAARTDAATDAPATDAPATDAPATDAPPDGADDALATGAVAAGDGSPVGRDAAERGARELPGHEWLVEFERRPDDLDAFARCIDAHLQDVNRHYQIRREANAFAAPVIADLPDGAFYDWLKATKEQISGQTKVPRMSEDRTVADGILTTAGKNR